LGTRAATDPALWEFSAYAHRWLLPERPDEERREPPPPRKLDADTRITFNAKRVAPLHRSNGTYWVDIENNRRGLRLPEQHTPALERLASGGSWTVRELQALADPDDRPEMAQLLAQLIARRLLEVESVDRLP
jgi:hypothetical protein